MTHNVGGKKSGIKKVFQAQETPYGFETVLCVLEVFVISIAQSIKRAMVYGTAESTILL